MPLDYHELIREARSLDVASCQESCRVAILADCTTQQLATLLRVMFAKRGIRLEVFEGPFDAIELQVYDRSSSLFQFAPDSIVVLNSVQALRSRYYRRASSGSHFLEEEIRRFQSVWDAIHSHCDATILQSNFVMPAERLFGNYDHKVADSLYSVAAELNFRLAEESRLRKYLFVNDVESISSYVGRSRWYDNRFWHLSKMFCAFEHLPLIAKNIVDIETAILGKTVKCIVVDLDNTIWGGVIGDDGLEGISLGAHGDGECFHDFQSFLREMQKRGIILAVCSKNDPEVAVKPFDQHPEMVLRREHIAVFMANWGSKADNIRNIQERLNIGMDSIVFIDDNPFERNLVRSLVPEIIVPELPEEPADYVSGICALNLFETASFSAEDTQRTELYHQRARIAEAQASFSSLEEYLESLQTEITVSRFAPERMARIAQLFQRSNQFNLTTNRRTEAECEALMADPSACPIYAELRDRFGDHGLISIVVAREEEAELVISDWIMSCRVLGRGVEQYLMNQCVEYAARRGKERLTGFYRPTAKNAMVKEFYKQFGFGKISETEDGKTTWQIETAQYRPAEVFIQAAALRA